MTLAIPGTDGYRMLRGFGGFLDARPICFVDPPPRECVCDMCGECPAYAKRLPCCHTVCVLCMQVSLKRFPFDTSVLRCPVDKRRFFQGGDYQPRPSGQARMWNLRVRCTNASGGCDFVGPLHQLERHCRFKCEYLPVPTGNACKRVDIVSEIFAELGSHAP